MQRSENNSKQFNSSLSLPPIIILQGRKEGRGKKERRKKGGREGKRERERKERRKEREKERNEPVHKLGKSLATISSLQQDTLLKYKTNCLIPKEK